MSFCNNGPALEKGYAKRTCSRSHLGVCRMICWVCGFWTALGLDVQPASTDEFAKGRDPSTAIRRSLGGVKLDFDEGHIQEAAGSALYEVALDAGSYVYATPDGKYLVAGDLFEVRKDRLVSITDLTRRTRRRALMSGMEPESMIVFAPDEGVAASVVVFTDTDCKYCRMLHSHMVEYHDRGIEIRYAANPRGGCGFAHI